MMVLVLTIDGTTRGELIQALDDAADEILRGGMSGHQSNEDRSYEYTIKVTPDDTTTSTQTGR